MFDRVAIWTMSAMFTVGVLLLFIGPLAFNSITLLLVGAALIVLTMLILCLFLFVMRRQNAALLKRDGVVVEGEVTDWKSQERTGTGRNLTSPVAGFITYRFTPNGAGPEKSITYTDNVWVAVHTRYPVGSRVPIRYLPADPTTCMIAGDVTLRVDDDVSLAPWPIDTAQVAAVPDVLAPQPIWPFSDS